MYEDLPGKIVVPADFGIENLNSRLHGNVSLKLEHSDNLLVNSIVLSLNSPVFVEMLREMGSRVLDMRAYTPSVVRLFMESLYTGRITIQKHDLKDFSKLASTYKVAWLIHKCHDFYTDLLDSVDIEDADDVFLLFEEACSIKLSIGDSLYIEKVLAKINTSRHDLSVFIERYTSVGYLSITEAQVDLIVEFNPEDYTVFLRIVKENVTKNQVFDSTSRLILKRVDLVKCMEQNLTLYNEVIDLILKRTKDISRQDKMMIHELNRDAMGKFKGKHECKSKVLTRSDTMNFATRALKSLKRMGTRTELKLLPSKFHVFQCYDIMEDLEFDDFLSILSLSSEVKSLFMMLESVDMFGCWDKFSSDSLRKVISTVESRAWTRIPRVFLASLHWLNDSPEKMDLLRDCSALCCDSNHTIMISDEVFTPRAFLLREKFYKFIFPRPRTTNCIILSTHCGILVKVTPFDRATSQKFRLEVVQDAAQYSEHKMHFHHHIVIPDRMHFVVEMFNEGQEDGVNMEVSWARGSPDFSGEGGRIRWGGWQWGDTHNARLILYYDNTQ